MKLLKSFEDKISDDDFMKVEADPLEKQIYRLEVHLTFVEEMRKNGNWKCFFLLWKKATRQRSLNVLKIRTVITSHVHLRPHKIMFLNETPGKGHGQLITVH